MQSLKRKNEGPRQRAGNLDKIIILGFLLFCAGTMIFFQSMHNIDLSYNMKYGGLDINSFGYIQDSPTMYLNGLTGIHIAYLFLLSGATIFLFAKLHKIN